MAEHWRPVPKVVGSSPFKGQFFLSNLQSHAFKFTFKNLCKMLNKLHQIGKCECDTHVRHPVYDDGCIVLLGDSVTSKVLDEWCENDDCDKYRLIGISTSMYGECPATFVTFVHNSKFRNKCQDTYRDDANLFLKQTAIARKDGKFSYACSDLLFEKKSVLQDMQLKSDVALVQNHPVYKNMRVILIGDCVRCADMDQKYKVEPLGSGHYCVLAIYCDKNNCYGSFVEIGCKLKDGCRKKIYFWPASDKNQPTIVSSLIFVK